MRLLCALGDVLLPCPKRGGIDWAPDKQSHCSPETVWSPIWWYGRISPARPLPWEHVSLLSVCAGCGVRVTLLGWCFIVPSLQILYSLIVSCICVYLCTTVSTPRFVKKKQKMFVLFLLCLTFFYAQPPDVVMLYKYMLFLSALCLLLLGAVLCQQVSCMGLFWCCSSY